MSGRDYTTKHRSIEQFSCYPGNALKPTGGSSMIRDPAALIRLVESALSGTYMYACSAAKNPVYLSRRSSLWQPAAVIGAGETP